MGKIRNQPPNQTNLDTNLFAIFFSRIKFIYQGTSSYVLYVAKTSGRKYSLKVIQLGMLAGNFSSSKKQAFQLNKPGAHTTRHHFH